MYEKMQCEEYVRAEIKEDRIRSTTVEIEVVCLTNNVPNTFCT